MVAVEQIKLKRSGTGLRAWDRDRVFPGFTLFAPQSGGGQVYLIDLEGKVVHSWRMPYSPGNYGYLTERGTLFFNAKTVEDSARFISRQPWKGGAALEADWSGRILWEVRHPDHHHDGIKLRNGNVLLLCLSELPQDLVSRVEGGMPGTEHQGKMYADYLVEMTTEGLVVWEWRSWEHLDPERDRITAVQSGARNGPMETAWPSYPTATLSSVFARSQPSLLSTGRPRKSCGSSALLRYVVNMRRRRYRTVTCCCLTTARTG